MNYSLIPKSWRRKLKYLIPLLFVVTLFAVLLGGNPNIAFSQHNSQEIRGVWITNNDADIFADRTQLISAIDRLSKLNFNTVYPVVWNSGEALYPSATAEKAGIPPGIYKGLQGYDILAEISRQAHSRDMLVIPWFEFGFMAPPSSELALNHPQWLTKQRDGTETWEGVAGEVVWLNPFHPEVQQFISNLILDLFAQYDIDGIQFDDHTSLPKEFGYDRYTLQLYKQETGNSAPANPADPEWIRWRANKLTAFIEQINQKVKAIKPNAIISIAPNPYDFAYRNQLQDWLAWIRQDLADELIVQVYRNDLNHFIKELNRSEIQESKKYVSTGVGILTGLRNKPVPMKLIQNKVYEARDRGLGFTFFFYESLWDLAPESAQERQNRFMAMFRSPSIRSLPELPQENMENNLEEISKDN